MYRSTSDYTSNPSSEPTSTISLGAYDNSRSFKFIGVKNSNYEDTCKKEEQERKSFVRLLKTLCMTNLVMSALLFIAVAVAAACLCKPVSILGGLLVSLLLLSQGIVGHHIVKLSTRSLLIGYSCLSGFIAVMSLGSSFYMFSGQYVLACISPFHADDYDSVARLYVVQVTVLISTIPLLIGAVSSLITSVLCANAVKKPQKVQEPQMFLYLRDSYNNPSFEEPEQNRPPEKVSKSPNSSESPPVRHGSPPPTYRQVNEESFA